MLFYITTDRQLRSGACSSSQLLAQPRPQLLAQPRPQLLAQPRPNRSLSCLNYVDSDLYVRAPITFGSGTRRAAPLPTSVKARQPLRIPW